MSAVPRPRMTAEEAALVEPEHTPIPNYAVDEMFAGTSGISAGQLGIFSLICRHSFESLKPCILTDAELRVKAGQDIRSVEDVTHAIKKLEKIGYIAVYYTDVGRAIIPDHYAELIAPPR